MIQTLFFDLGNVILFFSYEKMFLQLEKCSGIKKEEIQKKLIQDDIQNTYESGKISTERLYQYFLTLSKKSFSLKTFKTAFSDIFTPNIKVFDLLKALKKEKLELILVSNTNEAHYEFVLSHYPILQIFDQQILSFQIKTIKPDPSFFQTALRATKSLKSDCFYIDDMKENVASARKIGLDGEVYTQSEKLIEHLISRGLSKEIFTPSFFRE